MPRVLLISYHFPPAPGVAAARVGKLAKYLARLGWRPTVLAAPAYGRQDPDLLADVAGIDARYVAPRRAPSILQRADWAAAALKPALSLARAVDAVLISGGPFAPLVLGPLLRRPYVVDLRDPWSWEPRFDRDRSGARRTIAAAVERGGERYALRRAAGVVTVAPEIAAEYERRDSRLRGRFTVVRHGFDPEDFPSPRPAPAEPPTLVHVGTMLRGERTPDLILATARRVRERGTPLRVRLVGHMPEDIRPADEDWIEIVGPVPHREAAAEMCRASVLWAQPGSLDFLITGKVYEYLGAARPIVAVAPPAGSIARLLGTTGGAIVTSADAAACADAVAAALVGAVPARDAGAVEALAQPEPARQLVPLLEAASDGTT